MLVLIASALAGPCDQSVLGPALTAVENGYLNGNADAVNSAMRTARKEIKCDVTPDVAARFHRANALQKAIANDWATAEVHLRASIAAAPLARSPILESGDPRITLAWQRAQETPIVWKPAKTGMVNGLELAIRPDVPYIGDGSTGGGSGGSSSAGPALRWAALGGAVLTAGLYGGALASRSKYERVKGGPSSEVLPAYHTTNGLFFGAVGTGIASAGLLGVSFAL
ncbi:MAG: hypothetical protein H6737_07380 [Alphaproteobacteria bacterium]|nr:hypothetical protein [Alphaproteobacteria bacterium]